MNIVFWLGLIFGLPIGIVASIIANRLDPSVSSILAKSSSSIKNRSIKRLQKEYSYILYLRDNPAAVSYVLSTCSLRTLFCCIYVGFLVMSFIVLSVFLGMHLSVMQDDFVHYALYVLGLVGSIGFSANMLALMRTTRHLAKLADFDNYQKRIVNLTTPQPIGPSPQSP